ncbi:MAG TPA: glycoside hydrolase family 9 protein, partial [Opitutaceae bacterium]|nr:glycoside hydrolase family 9 protein [Opitutaceae bacterium]
GQWQPTPVVGKRVVDRATGEVSVHCAFPDESKDRKGFNPIEYPDLKFGYTVRIRPEGAAFRIVVDLDAPLPAEWIGRVGFNFEFFPGLLFGKSFATEDAAGQFPLQPAGPGVLDAAGEYQQAALATGRTLTVAPEDDALRTTIRNDDGGTLELVDGRAQHSNGWFVVRSTIAAGATQGAINWLVSPHALPGWTAEPVVQVSQVGYHPTQEKWATIELDPRDSRRPPVVVSRVGLDGKLETMLSAPGVEWGRFLRSSYLRLDFSKLTAPGLYVVSYGDVRTHAFRIADDVYARGVWQPTLEYFLPIQMCHMRINDRYRVWHGACHLDDARMAPVDFTLFDGYAQGPSTLCKFQPGEPVPGLNRGGWHDAGDDDLRIESQIMTVYGLALAYENFKLDYDGTTIDPERRVVEIQRPDGKPDALQQIEHGLATVLGGYRALGRFYRGIIVPTKRQYTHLGEFSMQTDNVVFDPKAAAAKPPPVDSGLTGSADDRWVFTEENPFHEFITGAGLAAAARVLRGYNDPLAVECRRGAEAVWAHTDETRMQREPWMEALPSMRVPLAVELLLTTGERRYADYLVTQRDALCANLRGDKLPPRAPRVAWVVSRVLAQIGDAEFTAAITAAARDYRTHQAALEPKTPYGVPYEPDIWGAGWQIQAYGVEQYFLHRAFPEIFPREGALRALNFILGHHPGPNTASFVSGVGARSVTQGYGFNRADRSHLPGGSVSGTALIRPDFPELLEWPYLWQQTEYVLGGGTTDYLFLVLAADSLLRLSVK